MFDLILGVANNYVIGNNGTMPWPKMSGDMAWFKEKTNNRTIIMGRLTWESLPGKLPNRKNIVISSEQSTADETITFDYFNKNLKMYENSIIIGGSHLATCMIPYVNCFYLTKINYDCDGDTFFNYDLYLPQFTCYEQNKKTCNGIELLFEVWKR